MLRISYLWTKLMRIHTFWLIQALLVIGFVAFVSLLLLDIFLTNLSYEYGWILVLLAADVLFDYLIVFLSGRWDRRKQRYVLPTSITIFLIILTLSCLITYYQSVFMGQSGMILYIEPLGLALIILLFAVITSRPSAR